MDSRRFDQLTRALATDASRRSVLGTVLAAAVALLFPRTGRTACIPVGDACVPGDECCAGHTCFEATCDCPSAIFDDAGNCAPPRTGDAGCRPEGDPCASNADCCVDLGLTCQDGVCLPAITVPVECGEVGDPCGVGTVCCGAPATTCSADGLCTCADPLVLDRTGLTCVAVCSHPDEPCADDLPCCNGAGTCVDGVCRCPDELRPCGATCVDPGVRYRRDLQNCGARGNACLDGELCCEGVCVREDSLATDPDHCGDCCTTCHPWEICCDGVCQQPFVDGLGEQVCCDIALVCAPGDGTELCCGPGETCHNGGCCHVDRVCGETCCGEGTSCHCGQCVAELESCEDDGACCGRRCVDGVCCPGQAVCSDEAGVEFCCGVGSRCDGAGSCAAEDPATVVPPVRAPIRPAASGAR